MLIQVDAEPENIQVVEGYSHPESGLFGGHGCVLCGSVLHGHGWRKRWVIDDQGKPRQYWIQRLRCPKCKQTYTLIPRWLHVFKLHALDVVKQMLIHRLKAGHFKYRSPVPVYLQKVWWRQFMSRCMLKTSFHTDRELEATIGFGKPQMASRLSMNVSDDNGTIRVLKSRFEGTRHPLHLLVLPSG